MSTKKIIVTNLDKLVEEVVEVGYSIQKISYEDLEKELMSDREAVIFGHGYYFTLFKLISEQPENAVKLLERVTNNQVGDKREEIFFKQAQEPKASFVFKVKEGLLESFRGNYESGPTIHPYLSSELFAIVKYDSSESLDFFQECYEEMLENGERNKERRLNFLLHKDEILAVLEALKTRDFSKRGKDHRLELRFIPTKETIQIPKSVADDYEKTSKYLMKQEGTTLDNIGFIDDPEGPMPKAILIPMSNDSSWSKGLYIVTHPHGCYEPNKIYKTEKTLTDKELISKTTNCGKVIRACQNGLLSSLMLKRMRDD